MNRVEDVSGTSLVPFVCAAVEADSEVRTDGWNGYNGLSKKGYSHHRINISQSGDPAHVSMPGVHRVASLLKRWLLGTHQGSVTAEHLDAYLDEFAFASIVATPADEAALPPTTANAVVTPPTRYRPSRFSEQMEKHNL